MNTTTVLTHAGAALLGALAAVSVLAWKARPILLALGDLRPLLRPAPASPARTEPVERCSLPVCFVCGGGHEPGDDHDERRCSICRTPDALHHPACPRSRDEAARGVTLDVAPDGSVLGWS